MTMNREEITNNVGYAKEKANLEYIRYRREHGVNDPYMITEIDEAFDAGYDKGYQYAQTHPNWIAVEDELPPHRNKSNHKFENDFSVNCFVSDGIDVDTGYYDYRLRKWNCEFLTNVVYWYCPQPPRKEDKE